MDTTQPGFYKRIKDNNFNISMEDYQEISKVLLNDIEKNKITEEEFNKILHILYLFDSDDETNKINSKEEFETKLKKIRKYTKYQPSLSKLVKVYRRDIYGLNGDFLQITIKIKIKIIIQKNLVIIIVIVISIYHMK